MDRSDIVKDSSVWYEPSVFSAANKKDTTIRIGIVRKAYFDKTINDLYYHVQIQDKTDKIEARCRLMRKLGGTYNYEDTVLRGYHYTDLNKDPNQLATKAGDIVVVAFINGESRDGVILGGLNHPSRPVKVDVTKGPQYASEFNGIETVINEDGEQIVTFKGQPTNINKLNDIPSNKLPTPIYDKSVGTSYYKFDKTGSWQVNDNAVSNKQYFKVDKPNGKILLVSGKVEIVLNKNSEDISVKTKTLKIDATESITENTKEYSMSASTSTKIKSPKVAIGTPEIELLDQIVKAIDAMAKVTPISPVGPCTSLGATPEWPDVDDIKSKIKQIKGAF